MSPSESELRAALHEGEGGAPDADLVIARALRVRYQRRRLITSVASAAAVVAVVAVGGTLLARTGTDESAGSGNGGGAALQDGNSGPARGANSPVPAAPDPAKQSAAASDIACAAQFPRLVLPGGGGTSQFGADEPLFSAPVAAMKICVYGPTAALVEQTVLSASTASTVAAQLESGDPTNRPNCPTTSDEGDLAVHAVTSAGTPLPVVTVGLGCPFQATNGTAVRWLSAAALDAVRPQLAPGPNQGSPVK